MTKEFSIGLEYAENGVIVRQKYEDGAPLVELIGDDYKELIEKLGRILWSELYYCNTNNELIDNLFDMCVLLKEEGVI